MKLSKKLRKKIKSRFLIVLCLIITVVAFLMIDKHANISGKIAKQVQQIQLNMPETGADQTASISDSQKTSQKISSRTSEGSNKYEFGYTGNYQEFVAPQSGWYKFECWGAKGDDWGKNSTNTGYGGYTSGLSYLKEGERVYVYVGASGANGGYNGGGNNFDGTNAGGGATDIRLTPGKWNDVDSLKSRIMVAGGGGGHFGDGASPQSASAGGLLGYNGTSAVGDISTGGTQEAGGDGQTENGGFGYGGQNAAYSDGHKGGAGGGGYYGGGGTYWHSQGGRWFIIYIRT